MKTYTLFWINVTTAMKLCGKKNKLYSPRIKEYMVSFGGWAGLCINN